MSVAVWLLMIISTSANSGMPPTPLAKFDSQAVCEANAKLIYDRTKPSGQSTLYAQCVPVLVGGQVR